MFTIDNEIENRQAEQRRKHHVRTIITAMRAGHEALSMLWTAERHTAVTDMLHMCSFEQLADMAGFIHFTKANWKTSPGDEDKVDLLVHVSTNLSHDLGGIARRERCFLPRTSGYAKHLEK